MPPPSRNQRTPTAGDTPATTPASSLDKPSAIAAQNCCRSLRRATGGRPGERIGADRKSTRLNSSHTVISYAVFCLKKKKRKNNHGLVLVDDRQEKAAHLD